MAGQLVYTSAAKLLDAGRSGFGTVARSRALSPLVVGAVERVSQFDNLRGADRGRVVYAHRRVVVGSQRWHVLSRIGDAGVDYTGRTNHLAHHLLVAPDEAARAAACGVTPADVLAQFGWLERWDGGPRYFGPEDEVAVADMVPRGRDAGRVGWCRLTGEPLHARLLAWESAPRTGVLVVPAGADVLALMAEALAEFGEGSWGRTFTTGLEGTDELGELDWVVSTEAGFGAIQARCGARTVYDLSQPGRLPLPAEAVAKVGVVAGAAQAGDSAGRAGGVQVQVVRQPGPPAGAGVPGRGAGGTEVAKERGMRWILWALAGAVVVLVSVVAVVVGFMGGDGGDLADSRPARIDPGEAAREKAERVMVKAGLNAEEARKVAENAGDAAGKWAGFVADILQQLGRVGADGPLPSARPPAPGEPAGTPAWLGGLVAAVNQIAFLKENDTLKPAEFFEQVDKIRDQLDEVLADVGVQAFDREDVEALDGKLLAMRLERARWELAEVEAAVQGGGWDEAGEPRRHAALVAWLVNGRGLPRGRVERVLKEGGEWSGMMGAEVPDEGRDGGPAAVVVDLAGIADREVRVVSRADLEKGCVVPLLERLMKAHHREGAERLELSGMEVVPDAGEAVQGRVNLLLSDDRKYYSRTKVPDAKVPRYWPDGRFAVVDPAVGSVRFACGGRQFWLVVDDAGKGAFKKGLGFVLDGVGDEVSVAGDLAGWLACLGGGGSGLLWEIAPPLPGVRVEKSGVGWRLVSAGGGKVEEGPGLVVAKADDERVRQALKAYQAKAVLASGSKRSREEAESARKTALAGVGDALALAVGRALLRAGGAEVDGVGGAGAVARLREKAAGLRGISAAILPEGGDDAGTEAVAVCTAVGRELRDRELKRVGRKVDWEALSDDKAAAKWVVDSVELALQDWAERGPAAAAGGFEAVRRLSVRTVGGRTLFEAERK